MAPCVRADAVKELALKEHLDGDEAQKQFNAVLPIAQRVYKENGGDNRAAWVSVAEKFRSGSGKFDPNKHAIVNLILSAIGQLDVSTGIERLCKKVNMIESKNVNKK